MKIKKGDKVLVISGKNRGKIGKVMSVFYDKSRVIVEGVNLQKKHVRPKKQGEKGQMVEVTVPIDISNIKLICDKCNKATRVGYKVEGKEKFRICKKCEETIK
ncbi:MAG: 50S ribosomal protein L24 [Candidatus Spechtbacteria bacterium RIFCSPLOWO2_12_FULL_38_22]|uniref:Large ribosomal subunit protein uL24 n=1 Tax=Candidatus Spechtbacteria bacterium RIFCSPLOWO2_12_FULL_38_22 TaxID=1802165 RepID=A0A1G2HIA1_9BACT|nr:MAG: 50S ribosomal protein L24 [Candidatus Spechtbacteria bacterium RIFCSPHIGHO2_01_FULL_38_11]OGZ59300.1 MAG: 50S ribosomal protein L24 [Candidatus Spechtbacteria bacterium RIFCSPHIGHO2_12_FULL_38_30]OGZ60480.1 MAG: 50S ribosomal protein L24 [Candidatus Spechtbacteria bacterium RIFCSPLOWO2_01_FULL_38_20]OGZ62173.1 MAG: 50S ribosomal protein L24 [Candidatus Spechtbacteria bacterium RIFCSPLOWO2_12_FULL_38_22]